MTTAVLTKQEQGVTLESHPATSYVRDERVNRFMSPARVSKLRAELDLDAIGMFVVSERKNGDRVLLDGAHRDTALVEEGLGEVEVPALVYHGLSMDREAALFLKYNNRLAVDILERFRLEVQAEVPEAVILDREIKAAGFMPVSSSKNRLTCIKALQTLYRGGSPSGRETHLKTLRETLSIIERAWGTEGSATKETVSGIGNLLLNHGDEVDVDHLVEALSVTRGGANAIKVRADYHKSEGGKRLPVATEMAVAERYSDKLPASKKIKVG